MLVRSDIPQLLTAGMKKEFMRLYGEEVVPEYERIATVIKSDKKQETYPWLGSIPKMHEWKDERIPEGMLEHHFTVVNRDFESSIAVDKTALEDDLYSQIMLKVRELATEAKRFIGELLFTLLDQGNGTSGSGIFDGVTISCYDGQAFFSSSHSEGDSGTQSNYSTNSLTADNLKAALSNMQKIKDDKGKYIGVRPDLLVVNPENEWKARELLKSTYYPEKETTAGEPGPLAANVLKGTLDLYVTPFVSDYHWFLLDTKHAVKPLIFQKRKEIEFTSSLTGPEAFLRKKLYFGIDFRGEAAFGMWQFAYGAFATS